ncbi:MULTISPECIES: TetR/AcrR family transcriptional regulator [Amycolatopsis]|uniref:TetR/AcrR family transcriptional regulator, lmrAB and yxaGH operons repressor n=2 Tax=Amycolatopsis TaxID=1813 RepID=A0A1I4DV30_9PSEU|nr:TetR/AcrR family transcriptional regulator [Amycolatopsis sacchari]SFK96903.1 TetR/AcrR family transcriptional regulator, lmrAB and yxaGH operons repressor [Amycolatopsis sacchari]
MARRTDTRQRMLDSAADLFHTQGYHATGLNQLVNAGGAPKGSLYFHFPGGKEQLAAEAVTLSGERVAVQLRDLLHAAPDPGTAIVSVLEALAHNLIESDFRRGCPIATVAVDAGESAVIRDACASGYTSWRDVIADYLVREGFPDQRAASLAVLALSAIEGALLLAKTQHDVAPLRTVAEYLRTTFTKET